MGASRPRRIVGCALVGTGGALVLWPALGTATIEEQRARLPPPATCTDPIEGVWMSHKYETPWDEWMVFTLNIRRRGATLTGDIQAHAWFGAGPQGSEPQACAGGRAHWIVAMTAQGRADGRRLEFWGTRWHLQSVFCGAASIAYNLDHFSGVIDPARQEFQSVNNDGGRSINDPTVFRRVQCFDPASPPHPYVAPPPFFVRRRASGCAQP